MIDAAVVPVLASLLSTGATLRPRAEQRAGPYHRDAQPLRRDLAEDHVARR